MKRVRILSIDGAGALGQCVLDGRQEHVVVLCAKGTVLSYHDSYWAARRFLVRHGYAPESPSVVAEKIYGGTGR